MVVTNNNNSVNFMLDVAGRAKTSTAVGFEPKMSTGPVQKVMKREKHRP
jgi:hypothetical protein